MTITVEAAPGHTPVITDLARQGPVAGRDWFNPVVEHPSGRHMLGGQWRRHDRLHRNRPAVLVKHGIWAVSVGRDTDVEVEVVHHHTQWFDLFGQIGPLGWVTPFTPDDHRIGLGPVNDMALGGAGYLLHGFRSPLERCLDVAHYNTVLARSAEAQRFTSAPGEWRWGARRTRMVLRAEGDHFDVVWKGRTPIRRMRRPRWTRGVDRWGVHVIDISPRPGGPGWSWEPGRDGRPGLHDRAHPFAESPRPIRFDITVRCR